MRAPRPVRPHPTMLAIRRDPAYLTRDGTLLYTLTVQVEYRVQNGTVHVRAVTLSTEPADPDFGAVLARSTRVGPSGQTRVAVAAGLRFALQAGEGSAQGFLHRFSGFVDPGGVAGRFTLARTGQ